MKNNRFMRNSTKTIGLVILASLFVMTSCKKKNNSNATSDYIEADIDGTPVIAKYTYGIAYYFEDDDRLYFEKLVTSGSSQGWTVSIDDLDLDNISYPRTLRFTNFTYDPFLHMLYNNGISGPKGNYVINNLDSNLFSLTLTKWSADILEGNFSGKLRWGSDYDSTLTFTKGKFEVKLKRW